MTGDEYRQAMRHWATGVAVVTFHDGGAVRGLTVSSLTSVSLEPPLVLVCIARKARAHDPLQRADALCVNVLAEDQSGQSDHFAGRPAAAREPVEFATTGRGTPRLARCLAALDCTPVATHPAGDHTIIVARVDGAEFADEGGPLLYFGGRYASLG